MLTVKALSLLSLACDCTTHLPSAACLLTNRLCSRHNLRLHQDSEHTHCILLPHSCVQVRAVPRLQKRGHPAGQGQCNPPHALALPAMRSLTNGQRHQEWIRGACHEEAADLGGLLCLMDCSHASVLTVSSDWLRQRSSDHVGQLM